jgi:hypothetical protein
MHYVFRILVLVVSIFFGVALAQHNPDNDVYVTVSTPLTSRLSQRLGVGRLGSFLYNTQEAVHQVITAGTGYDIDRYYIHVCTGDSACIPVDPFRVHD